MARAPSKRPVIDVNSSDDEVPPPVRSALGKKKKKKVKVARAQEFDPAQGSDVEQEPPMEDGGSDGPPPPDAASEGASEAEEPEAKAAAAAAGDPAPRTVTWGPGRIVLGLVVSETGEHVAEPVRFYIIPWREVTQEERRMVRRWLRFRKETTVVRLDEEPQPRRADETDALWALRATRFQQQQRKWEALQTLITLRGRAAEVHSDHFCDARLMRTVTFTLVH